MQLILANTASVLRVRRAQAEAKAKEEGKHEPIFVAQPVKNQFKSIIKSLQNRVNRSLNRDIWELNNTPEYRTYLKVYAAINLQYFNNLAKETDMNDLFTRFCSDLIIDLN